MYVSNPRSFRRFQNKKGKKDFTMAETNAPAPQTPAPQTPAPAPKVKTAADSARSIFKEFKDFISRGNVLDLSLIHISEPTRPY